MRFADVVSLVEKAQEAIDEEEARRKEDDESSLSLSEKAIEPWRKNGRRMNMYYGRMLRRLCDALSVETVFVPSSALEKDAASAE